MALMGFGIGVAYSVMPALIVARHRADRTASATGSTRCCGSWAVAVGAAGVAAVLAAHMPPGG